MNPASNFLPTALDHSSGIIIFSLDRSYCYTSFNQAHLVTMKKIWNVDIHHGDCMLDFIQSPDREKAKMNFDRALRGERFTLVEEYGDKKLYRSFWENRYDPVKDDEGNVVGLVVVVLDVSGIVEVSRRLEETQARLDLALESGKIGVWEWNLSNNELYWSDNTFSIFGLSQKEISFDDFVAMMHRDDRETMLASVQRALELKSIIDSEFRIVLGDKSIRWVRAHARVRFDESNTAEAIVGTVQDITKQKEIEAGYLQKNEELTKTNSELDSFVYSASHDLRAPISSMLGLIQVARLENSPENLTHLLDLQEKNLLRLDSFIRDIVDYSRNTRLHIEPQPIDFQKILNETLEQFRFYENINRIRIDVDIQQEEQFMSDERRLRIVLNNLLSNSIKYADLKKSESFIDLRIHANATRAHMVIRDNGEGISVEHQDRIFNMFFRASHQSQGSGLGLYIVKEVVNKLNGSISFESVAGEGTVFQVLIPSASR